MSKKTPKPDPDKEIIGPTTRKIIIEHVMGNRVFPQELTIPWRRRFTNIYQFKCTLLETDPPVWRRIQVPESYTFYDLHVAIQDAMKWWDYHLHYFKIPGIGTLEEVAHVECPWVEPRDTNPEWLFTTEVPIKDYLKKPSDMAFYCYDYGDNWQMSVTLEKILPKTKNTRYPVCIGGKLAAPPEDCGGAYGYYRCIEAFDAGDELYLRPDTEENEELREILDWFGDWNPYVFDPKKIRFDNPRNRFITALDFD